jgi:putative hydroxymethylpyrimidine transport system substrate-binding protein
MQDLANGGWRVRLHQDARDIPAVLRPTLEEIARRLALTMAFAIAVSLLVSFTLTPALAAGKVDAIIGGYWNIEVPDLKAKGVPVTVFKLEDNGVPTYDELVLAAGEDTIASNPEGIRRALAAIAAGTTTAQGDPAKARAYLIKANPDIVKGPLAAQLALTLPVLVSDGKPLGMDPAQWDALAKWMRAEGLVTKDVSGSAAVDTSLLPEASQ